MAIDILTIEGAQVGYRPGANGDTKYGQWLDRQAGTNVYHNQDWCGSSQMWCIAQGGPAWSDAAGGINKDWAWVDNWFQWFKAHGRLSRTPVPRRIVWYDWAGTPPGANHVGMVKQVYAGGTRMVVYEGNHRSEFQEVDRPVDSQVMGFGEWWSYVRQPVQPAHTPSVNTWFIGAS